MRKLFSITIVLFSCILCISCNNETKSSQTATDNMETAVENNEVPLDTTIIDSTINETKPVVRPN